MALPVVPFDPELGVKALDRPALFRLFSESWRRVGARSDLLKLFIGERRISVWL